MPTPLHAPTDIVSARGDAIRIVPLHVASDAGTPTVEVARLAPPVAPKLVYRNGPLLTQVQVFTIFWGAAWQQAANATLLAQVNQFFDFILTSSLIDQLGEYSVPGKQIGHGKHIGTLTATTPVLGRSVTDTAVQHMLQQLVSSGSVPPATANLLYFIYLPPGVKLIQGGGSSCQTFCGYHNDIAGQVFYAAMPYPGCSGCTGGLAARRIDLDELARALRGDNRPHSRTGLVRQPQRRNRRHLRLEDQEGRALHRATRMVQPSQRLRLSLPGPG